MNQMLATRRYGTTQQFRSPRSQEADVFRRVNHGLKAALYADRIERSRAVADNRRLWMAMDAAMLHPANQLPEALKGSILSLGRLIQREMNLETPDIAFLIEMNDQMIAGLSGDPG
ncbi:MAG: flagellar biosynthesis regulator FlaF [Alphaproteobacteria bacterium]|jgi:flagellar biosynthesis regulator FlaF